jgi:MFS transporter, NNP family, nitrate/nitrite transporter
VAINLVLRASYLADGTAAIAFWDFGVFYVIAALVTWRVYVRVPRVTAVAEQPVLAHTRG